MTARILEELTETLRQVHEELTGKMHTEYNRGYIAGLMRACEAVDKVIKEKDTPMTASSD